jgi:hypothetical protein
MSEITCPSGLRGTIRKMKVQEARSFASQRKAKGDPMGRLLQACWEETVDPGPYDFGDKSIDWNKALVGDRLYALMAIRIETFGPEYAFSVNCRERECRRRIEWELDLGKLPVRELTDESREAFINGNRFETLLPEAGKRLWFRMLVGEDEVRLARLRQGRDELDLFDLVGFRVDEVDGVEPRKIRAFIDDLSMADADFLIDELDRVDCGVDTAIDIECPRCGAVQEIELPFDRTFLMPGKGRAARRGRTGSFPSQSTSN